MTEDERKLRLFLLAYYKKCLQESQEDNFTALARTVGVAHSTLKRFYQNPMTASIPRTDTLLKLYVHTRVQIFAGFEQVSWVLHDVESAKEKKAINIVRVADSVPAPLIDGKP